jgi:predicted Zn-dependent protease
LWAQIAISRNDASKAIEVLQVTTPYELGDFYSVYVRGEAYLSARQGSQAQAEFKKILEHRGALCNSPFIAMALMGLARAYVLQGDTVKAREAFQDFLELWKDADSDVPLLIAAKAEFAQLH